MAEKIVSLERHDKIVGEIVFDETPVSLELSDTAYGLNLMIPAAVVLRWNDREQPCPLFTNLRVVISTEIEPGKKVELGRVRDDSVYFGTTSAKDHPEVAELVWMDVLPALVFMQHKKPDQSSRLDLLVRGELYSIANVVAATPPNVVRMQEGVCGVLSYPTKIVKTLGLTYPTDVWNQMIKTAL